MFPEYNIYSTPLLILTLQGLVFALLLLKKYFTDKNTSNLLLALILLITCYHQTSYTLGFMGWYDTFRNTKINYYLVSLNLALAPLIYLYVRSITKPKNPFTKKDLYHFIPISLLIACRIFILVFDANQEGFDEVQNGYLVINFQWKYLDPIVALLGIFQMLIYLVLSYKLLADYRERIQHFFSNTFKLELNWLKAFLIVYSILFVYQSVQMVVDSSIVDLSWRQEWWYYFLSGIAIIYVGIKGYFTDLTELKGLEISTFLEQKTNGVQSVKNNPVPSDELAPKILGLKEDVKVYFNEKKPYLAQELTLIDLAKQLSVSREELSETINKGFGLKFNDFINQYRIEDFKSRIAEGEHGQLSFLGLAYECGFNSKATFNRAFKKFTNTSPSEYLHSLQIKSNQ